jgi:signal transduction histidine kinase
MKDRSNDEYRETLQSVSTRIKDLSTLTNDLLELANSNVETLFQNFDEVRVDEILWDARERLLKQKPNSNIHIHFEDVADNELYLTCKGKAKLLETAFINIMDNACKFSENDTVEVTVVTDRKNIIIAFTDHGVGMPENYLTHVFEPFFRASNVHGVPGKGIGLSLVRGIISMHLGKIFIRSKLNEGTTVEVVLPNLSRV